MEPSILPRNTLLRLVPPSASRESRCSRFLECGKSLSVLGPEGEPYGGDHRGSQVSATVPFEGSEGESGDRLARHDSDAALTGFRAGGAWTQGHRAAAVTEADSRRGGHRTAAGIVPTGRQGMPSARSRSPSTRKPARDVRRLEARSRSQCRCHQYSRKCGGVTSLIRRRLIKCIETCSLHFSWHVCGGR